MHGKKSIRCVCIVALCCAWLAHGAEPKVADKDWKKIQIGDQTGYVIPPVVVRELGLPWEEIPEEQNAATYYIRAINAMPRLPGELSEAYNQAMRGLWGVEEVEFYRWFVETTESRELLRKATALKRCQFPFMSGRPGGRHLVAMLLPQLASMRNFARLLMIEGHLLEKEGELKEALESYLLTMRLAGHAAKSPTLINGLVGIACHRIAQKAIRTCLERADLPEAMLKWLAGELADAERFQPDRRRWIIGERAMAMQVSDVAGFTEYRMIASRQGPSGEVFNALVKSRAFRILWPDRTIRKDFENFYNKTDELARKPTWELMAVSKEMRGRDYFRKCVKDWNVLAGMLLPALERAQSEYVRLACEHKALQLNVALRRYRLEHGQYPQKLMRLVPEYIVKLPPDPFSGEDFHYRREKAEWLLYSVGWDLDDDGGRAGERSREDGDMVYRSKTKEGRK